MQLALAAHERLVAEGVRSRVVNLASWRLFQGRDACLSRERAAGRLPLSAGRRGAATFGWERWVGDEGEVIGLDRFGASAPADILFEQFGFTADHVYARARPCWRKER